MRFRISFHVKSALYIFEQWPVRVDGVEMQMLCKDGRLVGLTFETVLSNENLLPKISFKEKSYIKAQLFIPNNPDQERLESYARRVQTFLNSVAPTEINFESKKVEWVPENEDEKRKLNLFGYSGRYQKKSYETPSELTFDFVAALSYHAYWASDEEIGLSFAYRGNKEFLNRRFIHSFYEHFFFLETKYFPGHHKQKEIMKILNNRSDVISAASEYICEHKNPIAALPQDVINRLVQTRGALHHQSRKGPAAWHPDKPEVFEKEAAAIHYIVNRLAQQVILEDVFGSQRKKEFQDACRSEGAILSFNVEVSETCAGEDSQTKKFDILIPSKSVHFSLIMRINSEIRRLLSDRSNFVAKYVVRDDAGNQLCSYTSYLDR